EDDRHYFPPYDAVPVLNRASLDVHAGLEAAVAELAGRIHEDAMRRMNYAVDGEHRAPAEVARGFLAELGLSGDERRRGAEWDPAHVARRLGPRAVRALPRRAPPAVLRPPGPRAAEARDARRRPRLRNGRADAGPPPEARGRGDARGRLLGGDARARAGARGRRARLRAARHRGARGRGRARPLRPRVLDRRPPLGPRPRDAPRAPSGRARPRWPARGPDAREPRPSVAGRGRRGRGRGAVPRGAPGVRAALTAPGSRGVRGRPRRA